MHPLHFIDRGGVGSKKNHLEDNHTPPISYTRADFSKVIQPLKKTPLADERTCSRKEINALQADEDTIPYSERTIIIAPTTQEEIIPFNMDEQKRPLPYKDNLQQGRAIICPISHYKGASSTIYHQ